MSFNSPFPFTIDEEVKHRNPTCVFKLRFGLTKRKYFIFKGLRVLNTAETLSAQIHKERMQPKEDSILFKVISYIRTNKVAEMAVEVVKETDDTVDLLYSEYEALQAAKNDSDCLNVRFINNEYYPKWIPQKAILDFNKLIQGEKIPDKHKNLKKFLNSALPDNKKKPELVLAIMKYVTDRFN